MDAKRRTARQKLDTRIKDLKPAIRFIVPSRGWIRALRDALGMTAGQLGGRIGMRGQSVLDLEKSEKAGTIQLKTLRKAAEALDCTLVYALVPKTSLEDNVMSRARLVARARLASVDHSMDLEAQGLSKEEREARLDDYIREHIHEPDLWDAI